jgi:carboxymethylenebutenolidase
MKRVIDIETEDGSAPAGLFRPDGAVPPGTALTGIVFYMDAFGPRPALDGMAQRLANAGYLVLLPDLFYRFGAYAPFATTAFSDEEAGAKLKAVMAATTQTLTERDTRYFLDRLAAEGADERFGTVGYCMGGSRALNGAAAYADRIGAAASIHGGNLASDAPDSPYHRAAAIEARLYIAMAGVDRSFPPEQAARLAEALRRAGVDYLLENYIGMAHGWTVPDHAVYDEIGAERHWKRLLTFFDESFQ